MDLKLSQNNKIENKDKKGKFVMVEIEGKTVKKYVYDRTEYNKKYYQKNREKILDDFAKKVYCKCCEKNLTKSNFQFHKNSRKHIMNEKNQDKNQDKKLDKIDKELQGFTIN